MSISLLENGRPAIDTVVLATDFSASSGNAGRFAAALASHFSANLVVTHGFLMSQEAQAAEAETQRPSVERLESISQLKAVAAKLGVGPASVRTQLLDGDPSHMVPALVDSLPRALLVLGTHGGSHLGRHIIGSVAERCLHRAASPVLTVGPHVLAPDLSQLFSTMLYATDCSEMASRAAPLACAFANSFDSELQVISVVDDSQGPIPELLADLRYRTLSEVDRELQGQCSHFQRPRAVAKAGIARDEILRYASSTHSDLIVLGVHRRRTIELFDRNSVTIQLISKAPCPVLTLTAQSLGVRSHS